NDGILEVRRMESFICPSDSEVASNANLAALSYSANTGGWDWDGNDFLPPVNASPANPQGDIAANGVFLNMAVPQRRGAQLPIVKTEFKDGAGTTIMLSENRNKWYEPLSASAPEFTWIGGNGNKSGQEVNTEQQLGLVWVANTNPQAPDPQTDSITEQERI